MTATPPPTDYWSLPEANRIESIFSPPRSALSGTELEVIRQIHSECARLANVFLTRCPPGREKAVALTKLEEAMMWSSRAIEQHYNE